ncbi:hypothetical protein EVAR_36905_1 [Eumeta japonica]|uniref:Uncharacterized protein n=1 Tax=Eumeta variegata TaxID=151549 RepID=A0A4C1WTU3_EUMVA|nr:hypothetical protein EVAR_36905_1 [Eumeta japonica]
MRESDMHLIVNNLDTWGSARRRRARNAKNILYRRKRPPADRVSASLLITFRGDISAPRPPRSAPRPTQCYTAIYCVRLAAHGPPDNGVLSDRRRSVARHVYAFSPRRRCDTQLRAADRPPTPSGPISRAGARRRQRSVDRRRNTR